MVSMQFVETFTPQTEGNRVQGVACLKADIDPETPGVKYVFQVPEQSFGSIQLM